MTDEKSGINVQEDPFAYNKEFDHTNPQNFEAWLKMKPSHMSEGEWQFALGELQLLLENDKSEVVKTERDRSNLILGWKSKNGLLPNEN